MIQFVGLIIALIVAILIGQDASKRGMNAWVWGIGVFLLLLIFLPLYFILRKPELEESYSDSEGKILELEGNSQLSHNQKLEEIRNTRSLKKLRRLLVKYSEGWQEFNRASSNKSDHKGFANYYLLREIGDQAYEIGGISFMQKVCTYDNGVFVSDDWSDSFWQGLHDWYSI